MAPDETLKSLKELQKANDPANHFTVDLGIRKFKKALIAANPLAKKSVINKLVLAYKRRAWMEADGVLRGRGSIPSHPKYGKPIKVKSTTLDVGHVVKVKNGSKQK